MNQRIQDIRHLGNPWHEVMNGVQAGVRNEVLMARYVRIFNRYILSRAMRTTVLSRYIRVNQQNGAGIPFNRDQQVPAAVRDDFSSLTFPSSLDDRDRMTRVHMSQLPVLMDTDFGTEVSDGVVAWRRKFSNFLLFRL